MPRRGEGKEQFTEVVRGRCTAELKERADKYCDGHGNMAEATLVRMALEEFLDHADDEAAAKESRAIASRSIKRGAKS